MTQSDKSNSNGKANNFAVQLHRAADDQLADMAAEAGLSKSKLAAYLLEELLPTIHSVRTRLQIVRKPGKAE